ncbi:hypothetical protein MNBD_GAMMA20-2217 [hydrothermal vent metagenome]|uniref:Uncharacterized protein n=1 Tax=hydrothermal vent metagenome TaxID=652676 RepID=A0A3B1A973_9ZZZZ
MLNKRKNVQLNSTAYPLASVIMLNIKGFTAATDEPRKRSRKGIFLMFATIRCIHPNR